MTRRRFDQGPNTGVGSVVRQHGREREKGPAGLVLGLGWVSAQTD
jgi:hypothetical protein